MSKPTGEKEIDTYGRRIAQAHALALLISTGEALDALQEFNRDIYLHVTWLLEQTLSEAIEAMEAHLAEQRAGGSKP